MRRTNRIVPALCLAAIAMAGFTGCASVPPEAAALSRNLDKRVSAMEEAHISLVVRHIGERRARMREFFEKVWIPEFARNFVEDPIISNLFDQVIASDDRNDRAQFLLHIAPVIVDKLRVKEAELFDPIDDFEAKLISALVREYGEMHRIGDALTVFTN